MDLRMCFCSVLALVLFLGGASTTRNSTEDCIPVSCMNGYVLLPLSESVIDKRKDCEHGLYNELDQFVVDPTQPGGRNCSCDSQIQAQKMTWKIDCHNKTRKPETCFMINAIMASEDEPKNETSSPHVLALVVVPVLLVGVAAAVGIGYWRNRDGNRNPAAENQHNSVI